VTVSTSPTAPRRTQAERSASTRAALLQATIDCLLELGYARTTTQEVQARAGVSRGALTHHFASKSELLLAATDSLYEDFSAQIRQEASGLPAGPRRIRPGIALLWECLNGPLFMPVIELWVAARTDAELRAALLPRERRLGRQLRSLAVEVFGEEVSAHPSAEAMYQLLFTSMRGQAMTYALQPDAPREGPHLRYWYDLVEAFARP
jgi:AcrR family transcriptional regulator